MTYESDPTRWTQSPREAPDSLRAVFDAGRREGPSDAQMRALALKLAAIGGGAAVAASAATAHASAAAAGGSAMTGGGMLSLTKVAVSIALIGAAATGTALLRRSETPTEAPRPRVHAVASPSTDADAAEEIEAAPVAPRVTTRSEPTPSAPRAPAREIPSAEPAQRASRATERERESERASTTRRATDETTAAAPTRERASTRGERMTTTRAISTASVTHVRGARKSEASARASERTPEASAGDAPQAEEIDLLRRARAALAARPREAFRLTEQHRSEYPSGVFTQERDALAVEALLRSGELKLARELAEAFVRRYPSSPHAHRFRETMNLQ